MRARCPWCISGRTPQDPTAAAPGTPCLHRHPGRASPACSCGTISISASQAVPGKHSEALSRSGSSHGHSTFGKSTEARDKAHVAERQSLLKERCTFYLLRILHGLILQLFHMARLSDHMSMHILSSLKFCQSFAPQPCTFFSMPHCSGLPFLFLVVSARSIATGKQVSSHCH